MSVDPLGEEFIRLLPDGFRPLLAPAAALPAVFAPAPVDEVPGEAPVLPFTDDPVVVPPVETPPAAPPLLCAKAKPLERASAAASAILMSFMVVFLLLVRENNRPRWDAFQLRTSTECGRTGTGCASAGSGTASFTFGYPCGHGIGNALRGSSFLFRGYGAAGMDELARIDRALDELLVNLGSMVLRLASPEVSKTAEERQALARSVNQYSVCARRSSDPRVQQLNSDLQETLRPRLRIISSK